MAGHTDWVEHLSQAEIAEVERAVRGLEEARGSRAIGLIHRQEKMSFLGFPIARFIDIEDSERLLRAIQLTDPKRPIDLIVHTPGGLALAASQIAHALRRHKAKVTVFVPHYAMSGGTLIALAADQIVMAENAVLGPVDPQLGTSPAASIVKVLDQKPVARIDDQTIIQADVARKALAQVERTVCDLVAGRLSEDKASTLASELSSGRWTHDYPITVPEIRALGLPVSTEMPTAVYDLMQLYPQTAQRRPAVEYIDLPYGPPERTTRRQA